MANDRGRDAGHVPVVERVEARVLMSAGGAGASAGKAGIGGGLQTDSYQLVVGVGDRANTIGGTLKGDTLVMHVKSATIVAARGTDSFQVLRVGNNTIGGALNDPVMLVLKGNTIGGVVSNDGVIFRNAGAATVDGTLHPDTYVCRLTTVGGANDLDWVVRVGANTIGGNFSTETVSPAE